MENSPGLVETNQTDQLVMGSHLANDVTFAPHPSQPTAHVFLERNDSRCKVLVGDSVHASRKGVGGNSFTDLNNVDVIRVENDQISPWFPWWFAARSWSRIRCVSL